MASIAESGGRIYEFPAVQPHVDVPSPPDGSTANQGIDEMNKKLDLLLAAQGIVYKEVE